MFDISSEDKFDESFAPTHSLIRGTPAAFESMSLLLGAKCGGMYDEKRSCNYGSGFDDNLYKQLQVTHNKISRSTGSTSPVAVSQYPCDGRDCYYSRE